MPISPVNPALVVAVVMEQMELMFQISPALVKKVADGLIMQSLGVDLVVENTAVLLQMASLSPVNPALVVVVVMEQME